MVEGQGVEYVQNWSISLVKRGTTPKDQRAGKSNLHTHVSTRGKVWPEGMYKRRKEYFLV